MHLLLLEGLMQKALQSRVKTMEVINAYKKALLEQLDTSPEIDVAVLQYF